MLLTVLAHQGNIVCSQLRATPRIWLGGSGGRAPCSVNQDSWRSISFTSCSTLTERSTECLVSISQQSHHWAILLNLSHRNPGFELFKEVTMKNVNMQCGFIINKRFGETLRLHLQGRRNNAGEKQCQTVANRQMSVYNNPTRCHIPGDNILNWMVCYLITFQFLEIPSPDHLLPQQSHN
jgi:hypothetical protein